MGPLVFFISHFLPPPAADVPQYHIYTPADLVIFHAHISRNFFYRKPIDIVVYNQIMIEAAAGKPEIYLCGQRGRPGEICITILFSYLYYGQIGISAGLWVGWVSPGPEHFEVNEQKNYMVRSEPDFSGRKPRNVELARENR
jgi:hypothetical protein